MRKLSILLLLMFCSGTVLADPTADFIQLRDAYLEKVKPLEREANDAWWQASTTGSEEAYARRTKADNALAALQSDREVFAKLKALKAQGLPDPGLQRQLTMMYLAFLPKQADPELNRQINALEADVEKIFNTHRSEVNGQRLTENDVRKILHETSDTNEAKAAWTGYMEVGSKVEPKLKELVKLRNQVAQRLGFENYFQLKLAQQELSQDELFAIFDELDELTRGPFGELKAEIDAHMMKRFSLTRDQLRPWHTDDLFFQEAPHLATVNLDQIYEGRDPVKLSEQHYESMGMRVEAIIARSDLYEKEDKSPHAFCTNIDRGQDIRVLCNVKPNANWMDTMHHELGHGVYDQYIGKDVPFLLHEPAHILTTEGMAMLFGALTKNPEFIKDVVGVDDPALLAESQRSLRAEKLIFSRWTQVMLRFERGMYENPDQDLNALWWSLKKQYQNLNPPDDLSGADYGAKLHIVGAPCYYHNYMLGELFASQVRAYAAKKYLGLDNPLKTSFYGNKEAGEYFRDQIFAPGNTYDWRELTKRATGEPLTARYYAKLYVK
ncbi:MAG: M2 family metallopeptidase [Vulcanimicrobiota bacterium]